MPSLRTLLPSLGCAFALLQASNAAPATAHWPVHAQSSPTPPASGDATELPAPASNMTLLYVALGRGVQNYTCATSSVNSTPVSIGAIATLYDATSLAYTSSTGIDNLPAAAVYVSQPAAGAPIDVYGTSFPVLGNHYFNSSATPTFNLSTVGDVLWGKKTGDILAPTTSNAGPADTGAVDWLQLQDKGGSINLAEVYRVSTAGGNPPKNCSGQAAVISVQYAADYWFYQLASS